MVMVDEKYAGALGHKGMGKDWDMEWLIKDTSKELTLCGGTPVGPETSS